MDIKTWKSLSRKIDKLNEKYKGASLVVFGCVGKQLMVSGPAELRSQFADKPEVKSAYKTSVLGQTFGTPEGAVAELPPDNYNTCSLRETLSTHAYDMNVDTMRVCLGMAAGPLNTVTSKSGRRGWYKAENCPDWWNVTGIPFQSVNQRGPNGKKLTTVQLMQLVESLQVAVGIVPKPPSCPNKTVYSSMFAGEPPQSAEMGEEESTSVFGQAEEGLASPEVGEPPQLSDMEEDDALGQTEECPASPELIMPLSGRKGMIQTLAASDSMSHLEVAREIMKMITSWDVLWGLSDCILDSFRKTIPTCLSTRWSGDKLVSKDKR